MKNRIARAFILSVALATIAGCSGGTLEDIAPKKAQRQLPSKIVAEMSAKGMKKTSPILMRIFKEESVLEVWKQKNNGKFDLIASYEICKWSGELGPKFLEGDRQAPEGFYTVTPAQMNPNSMYHLAFNIGFPNAYDRANGRSGVHLMVHGDCSSAGCYSMTDPQIEEIYAFARDAFAGGQAAFQIQAYPFRMTPKNMARYKDDPNFEFWKMLKVGYDHFEITKQPPKVDVCEKQYQFNRIPAEGHTFRPTEACPPSSVPEWLSVRYEQHKKEQDKEFTRAQSFWAGSAEPPKPTILGFDEAKLVADWSRRRARGEKVAARPPSLPSPTAIAKAEPAKTEPEAAPAPVAVAANPAPVAEPAAPVAFATRLQQAKTAAAPAAADPAPTAVSSIPSPAPSTEEQQELAAAIEQQKAPQRRSAFSGLFARIMGN